MVSPWKHLSLILLPTLPAYDAAQVLSLSERSAADQRRHEESVRLISEWEIERIEREAVARSQSVA